jgi:hypothetical protein
MARRDYKCRAIFISRPDTLLAPPKALFPQQQQDGVESDRMSRQRSHDLPAPAAQAWASAGGAAQVGRKVCCFGVGGGLVHVGEQYQCA